jgi:hypothetical protein
MNTTKQPASASGAARMISRILKEKGFQKANRRFGGLTEGYYVQRIGYSVHADYHVNKEVRFDNENVRKESKVAQMREVLFELGYISSHPHAIYIECRGS